MMIKKIKLTISILIASMAVLFHQTGLASDGIESSSVVKSGILERGMLHSFQRTVDHLEKTGWELQDRNIATFKKQNQSLIVEYAPTGLGQIGMMLTIPRGAKISKSILSIRYIDSLNTQLEKEKWTETEDIRVLTKYSTLQKNGKTTGSIKYILIERLPASDKISAIELY